MKGNLGTWLFLTFLGLTVGVVIGYAAIWLWIIVRGVFQGFLADSGPSWVNLVTDLLFFLGVVAGIIGSQVLFFTRVRQKGGSSGSGPSG